MSECDEVASNMPRLPAGATYADALRYVREQMPGESETVISNVAAAMHQHLLTLYSV